MITIKPFTIELTPTEKSDAVKLEYSVAPANAETRKSAVRASFYDAQDKPIASRRFSLPAPPSEADILAALGCEKTGAKKNKSSESNGGNE